MRPGRQIMTLTQSIPAIFTIKVHHVFNDEYDHAFSVLQQLHKKPLFQWLKPITHHAFYTAKPFWPQTLINDRLNNVKLSYVQLVLEKWWTE
ncbi:hypothetical protein RRG08_063619 [Elysia crispata]|uniref:Uncharacterized protein n=1 Tax=Elysia crispata TaxID=231223 RepID=A0AAE1DYX6_9GAST|nr:hypothetical protein RRG08_063619 [Elysia crispata]